jgi:preprotein translocase subunit SecB
MADEGATGAGEPLSNGEDNSTQVSILAQYVKDLSFENPHAPNVYQWQEPQPRIDVQFNIGSNAVGEDVHEVSLKIDVRTFIGEQTAFAIELVYAGLFGLRNVPEDQLQPFLLAEAPRLLFPFARRIISDTVRDGHFPPLLLEPIDFGALYIAQRDQQQQLAEGEPAGQA